MGNCYAKSVRVCCSCYPHPPRRQYHTPLANGVLPTKSTLLHGILNITIVEMDTSRIPRFLQTIDNILGGVVAAIELAPVKVARTSSQERKHTVSWQESFRIFCAHEVSSIDVYVYSGAVSLGKAMIPVSDNILKGEKVDGWFNLEGDLEGTASIHILLEFVQARFDKYWDSGVAGGAFEGVPHTFFPLRKGCKVTPYQNAHIDDVFSPNVVLGNGEFYQPAKAWEDVYHAIEHAQHLVYIAGWSVNAKIRLVRDPSGSDVPGNLGETLGRLLTRKALEGVRVLLLVWDDKTDNLELPFLGSGIMHTHDEDTLAYFRDTKVECVLCPRNPSALNFDLAKGFFFTHHQKAVVVDAPALPPYNSSQRRLVAFEGGIDLCDGRYDTPSHTLFRYLNTLFKDDFHQSSIEQASLKMGGPREPWHDIYSKLEGPIAWDMHKNFTLRWLKQVDNEKAHLLVPIDEIDPFCPPSAVTQEDDTETWNVQLFRSIDDTSAVGFPENISDCLKAGLMRQGAGNLADRSIEDAYISAIRRAKRFLYLENQYFLGSSHAWDSKNDDSIPNLIPLEIALKIASKIHAGEQFSVYIVVPLWPDGVPTSATVQDILHLHRKTKEMMYGIIARALKETNRVNELPSDHLSFFCLGNRETIDLNELVPEQKPNEGSMYQKAQDNRRFMVYVHAKMMVVDDEYLVIGSANINQRSMDGGRDTEIAMGAFQPHHTMGMSHDGHPRAGVYGFRSSLWSEHLGLHEEVFDRPWTVECMKRVREIADQYWEEFSRPGPITDMKGHLMTYPQTITPDAKLTTLDGCKFFPDTIANILGGNQLILPKILTA